MIACNDPLVDARKTDAVPEDKPVSVDGSYGDGEAKTAGAPGVVGGLHGEASRDMAGTVQEAVQYNRNAIMTQARDNDLTC